MNVWRPLRSGKRSPHFFCKFAYQGKQYMRSTGEVDEGRAWAAAEAIYRRVTGEACAWSPLLDEHGPSLGAFVEVYESAVELRASPATRRKNVNDLVALVQGRFELERARILELPVQVIDGDTVKAFVRRRQGKPGVIRDRPLPANRTINSMLNHAKGVFGRQARNAYREAGLEWGSGIEELLDFERLSVR